MLVPLVVLVPLHRTMQEVDGAWLATRLSRRNLLLLHVALLLLLPGAQLLTPLLPYGAAGAKRVMLVGSELATDFKLIVCLLLLYRINLVENI